MTSTQLWMRWLDFRRLRDLLSIVAAHDCALRAKDLNELAVGERILVNDEGLPFKPTTMYHYRRTLERLGLVRLVGRRYCIVRGDPMVAELVAKPQRQEVLDAGERKAFATLVLRNTDCYEAFLKVFVDSDRRPETLADFIRISEPVSIRIAAKDAAVRSMSLRSVTTGFEMIFRGESATQAILWGIKPWCVEQLGFMDEVLSTGVGYVLYARHMESPWPPEVIARRLIELLAFEDEWATARVEELILKAGRRWRLPAQSTREALLWLRQRYPEFIATIATSGHFILSGLHPAQRRAALNSYVRLPTGEYVSHLRVHSRIAHLGTQGGTRHGP